MDWIISVIVIAVLMFWPCKPQMLDKNNIEQDDSNPFS